jgi:hypothetical protein
VSFSFQAGEEQAAKPAKDAKTAVAGHSTEESSEEEEAEDE